MQKYKDFEDYLQTKHAEQYTGLDDGIPDDYADWLDNLSIDEWIEYGNAYAKQSAAQILGNLGGEKTSLLLGKKHFSEAGKKGMAKRWGKYQKNQK